jgi:hypothetical protein
LILFLPVILYKAVRKIVTGIKNSTHLLSNLMISYTDNASVSECPIVKAVTRIMTCFQFLIEYRAANAIIKRIWSSALILMI